MNSDTEMKLMLYDLHPHSPKLNLIMTNNQTNFNRQTSYKMPDHFKTVNVIKNKKNLRNCHSQEKPKETRISVM